MNVRAATPDDVETCIDIMEQTVAEGVWLGAQAPLDRDDRRERFLAAIEAEQSLLLVAVDASGAVVGHLILEVAPYGVAHFGMCVAPLRRGRGAGTALVGEAVAAARRLGAHKISIQVWPHNGSALRLYAKAGFVREGRLRRHYPRGTGELWDVVVMGLVLDELRPGSSLADEDA